MTEIRKTDARDQSNISCSDHCDFHWRTSLSFWGIRAIWARTIFLNCVHT